MRRRALKAVAAGLLALHSAALGASASEAQVRAAYLFKLASFVRWPEGAAGGAFRFCTQGRSDVAAVLAQLTRGQQVIGKRIELVQLGARAIEQVKGCQILFVGRAPEAGRALIAAAGRAPVLTVTDRDGGTHGGAVEFVVVDGKVRFAVNRAEAEQRQLELSSKLMDVAVEVNP